MANGAICSHKWCKSLGNVDIANNQLLRHFSSHKLWKPDPRGNFSVFSVMESYGTMVIHGFILMVVAILVVDSSIGSLSSITAIDYCHRYDPSTFTKINGTEKMVPPLNLTP